MAFFDFLNQGVGGTTAPSTTPGLYGEGDIVVAPGKPIGPTWGTTLGALEDMSSRRAPSVPQMAPSATQAVIPPLQPVQMQKTPTQVNAESPDSLGAIVSLLMKLFGI